jgi:nitric oxide synthase oxygenase domain/subunit
MTTIDAFKIFGYGFDDVSALTKVNLSWFSVPVIIGLGMKLNPIPLPSSQYDF